MTHDTNLDARKLIEASIEAKEAELHKVDKERREEWRKHGRTQEQLKALNAELEGLKAALDSLGGPTVAAEETQKEVSYG